MDKRIVRAVQVDKGPGIGHRLLPARVRVHKPEVQDSIGIDGAFATQRHDFVHGHKAVAADLARRHENFLAFGAFDAYDALVVP